MLDRAELLRVAGAATLGVRRHGGDLGALRRSLRGALVTRADAGYARARLLYDTRFDGIRPLAVAYCASADDVARAIDFARRNAIRPRARAGGHSYGGYSTVQNGIVVDVSRLAGVSVAADGATALVGAGARLLAVDSALWRHGVAIPAGSCPTVGIAGLALGGGVGFASRKLGTTSDNVLEVQLVLPDGKRVTANARQHADLYWACRGGGGGNFGIATAFRFRVHPVSRVSRFSISWPWSDARAAIDAWQRFAPHAPDDVFSVLGVAGARTVVAAGQSFGAAAALRSLIAPLAAAGRPTSVSVVSSSWFQAVLHWAGAGGRATFKGASDYVARPLPPAGIDTIVEWIERRRDVTGRGSLLLDSYGGAINRVPATATAFVHRDALCSLQYLAYWEPTDPPAAASANLAWIRGFRAAMRPYVSGFSYQNYIDPDVADWPHAYYGRNLSRLVAVKRRYDPDDLFRFAQSISIR
jgi:FAD/FMN-containing dehydrogenase